MESRDLEKIAREYFDLGNEEEYQENWEVFKKCFEKIINYPYVKKGTPLFLENAMYLIAIGIARNNFFKSDTDYFGNHFDNYGRKHDDIDDIISEALYRTYGDVATPNLSSRYVLTKGLKR